MFYRTPCPSSVFMIQNSSFILKIAGITVTDEVKALIIGGETAMWSEQTDDATVEGKLFPRTSAYGERLWTSPSNGWYEAESRMLHQRLRSIFII